MSEVRLRLHGADRHQAAAADREEHGGSELIGASDRGEMADHQPLHRQEKMFERHGIDISRKTMGGWMAQCAELLDPLYQLMKKELLSSKVIGTDDTSVKVLDRKLPFARIGRIWPYVGDAHHPVIVYDYTPTRSRAGPAKFLEGYKGYLQADAYSVYDAFFKPQRGMTEVGCWMHYPDSGFIQSGRGDVLYRGGLTGPGAVRTPDKVRGFGERPAASVTAAIFGPRLERGRRASRMRRALDASFAGSW